MKLELKHIAPYLPYGLKMYNLNEGRGAYNTVLKRRLKKTEVLTGELIELLLFLNRKPILHPLSDLTKEIEHNGEKFVPVDKLNQLNGNVIHGERFYQTVFVEQTFHNMYYKDIQKLFQWHFDVFNLIEQNLAITKNQNN